MNLTNSDIKYIRSLKQKKIRDSEKKFLLEGWHSLYDALNSDYKIDFIGISQFAINNPENERVINRAKKKNILIREIKNNQLNLITDTINSQGVVALVHQKNEIFESNKLIDAKLIVACDGINDPGNLGTIIRTCDWFGVDAVFLNNGCVSLYNEKVIRATAGSIFHLKIYENIEYEIVLPQLKINGFKIIGTTLNGKSLYSFTPQTKQVIMLGSEAHGIDKDVFQLVDEVVSIPRFGRGESLNVGIACGVILSYFKNK